MKSRILVIDDEANIIWLFREIFDERYEVIGAETGREGLDAVKIQSPDLVMLDLRLPDINGLKVLEELTSGSNSASVIIMTAYGEIQTAVEAMKLGAHDYITKPFEIEKLKLLVQNALNYSRLTNEVTRLRHELEDKFHFRNIVTVSPRMLELFSLVERVSISDVPVLLLGESGTGKDILARAIHQASPRRNRPFVPVNCAALPENLLESELFGYEEGAFSGARRRKPGKFEMANGGTLFLDEVGELPLDMQPKILRALEEKEIDRLGSTKSVPVDVRIVAASNKDIPSEVKIGRFRQDLYFRLAVIPVVIPPLRERKEDIPVLARHFLNLFAKEQEKIVPKLGDDALFVLVSYPWPGNVRELKNVMHQICILCDRKLIGKSELPPFFYDPDRYLANGYELGQGHFKIGRGETLKEFKRRTWERIETDLIKQVLDLHGHNRTHAAESLGLSRRALQMKIKEYNL